MSQLLSNDLSLPWQALQPQLSVNEFALNYGDFWALQENAAQAISLFLALPKRNLLLLKVDEAAEYAPFVADFIQSKLPAPKVPFGVNYLIEQGDSFSFPQISVAKAQSFEDNFAARGVAVQGLHFDRFHLFGSLQRHATSHDIQLKPGLVHQANGGVLILSAAALLAQFELWGQLKNLLQTQRFDWYSAHPFKNLPCDIPSFDLQLKVVILGNRTEIATLGELEEMLYSFADYAEIESAYEIKDAQSETIWADYLQHLAQLNGLQLDFSGINKLYQLLVRETEDRFLIDISPDSLVSWLTSAATLSQKTQLSAADLENVFLQRTRQYGFLRERTYADILNEQIYVETDGEIVGQINGLSVIEYPGTPVCFGEPSRISCLVQFGDGEVVDVERKNELAGNLHGKGMMIAEACLAGILELPSQLPFSASLVFEQSYGEIDGDSASLAIFSALVSALADLPLPQNIAITGAIDQFGLVHAVGGVNEKIEGFFEICRRRGLTGKQGVIIPATTIQQLSLKDEVVAAVKNQQFFIYCVEDIYQTASILFNRDLLEEKESYPEGKEPISRLIQNRIAMRADTPKKGFFDFFKSS